MDELKSPKVIRFLEDGQRLLTGGFHTDRMLQVFDAHRPGRHPLATLKLGKTRRSKDGQKGIVSALASCHDGVIAVGTVSPGSIYLYDVRTYCQEPVAKIVMMGNCMVGHGKRGNKRKRLDQDDDSFSFAAAKQHWYHQKAQCGVTQMEFTDTNGNYLFSTSRRSNAIVQWDLQKLSCSNHCPGVASYAIQNDTNQRIVFELHSDRLYAGGTDGCV
jgi:WD40 repeat protein